MSDALPTTDSREDVFGRFYEELETATDKEAVVRRYAAEHPRWSADFRAEAAIEVLVHAKPAPGEPYPEGLPDFRIHRKVAEGGMGVVYEAEQLSLHRRVALKVRRQRLSPAAQARFEREQEVLARLHQTHIVPIHTAGQVGPWQYFAMAYIEGAPLHRLVQTAFQRETAGHAGKTPPLAELASEMVRQSRESNEGGAGFQPAEPTAEPRPVENRPHNCRVTLSLEYFRSVARVMADAAEALEHAHEKHILHRDVKPSNLMIDTDGKCWLIDFGLAYSNGNGTAGTLPAQAEQSTDAALTAGPLGTPGYMAPEQYRERAEVRSDVWGLGVTLYELLTLRPAFEGRTQEEVRAKVLADEPTPMQELAGDVPADLVAICRKAMRKEAGQRYATAGEVAEDLRRWLRWEPTKARPVWVGRWVVLWARRNTGWAAALVICMLAVGTLSVGTLLLARSQAAEAEARATVLDTEIVMAREAERSARREILLQQIENTLRTDHRAGWWNRIWNRIAEAATGRKDTTLRNLAAWSLAGLDAQPEKSFGDPEIQGASAVAFDGKGERLLLGGTFDDQRRPDKPARLWKGGTSPLETSGLPGAGPVIFRSTDGAPLQMTAADPWTVVLWDVSQKKEIRRLRHPDARGEPPAFTVTNFPTMALTADGSLIAASVALADDRWSTVVWEVSSRKVIHRVEQKLTALAFSGDQRHLAAGSEDGWIIIWLLPQGKGLARLRAGHALIHCLAFTQDHRRETVGGAEDELAGLLASGDAAGGLLIWDLRTRQIQARCTGSSYNVYAVTFSPDGSLLASGGRQPPLIWDAATGDRLLNCDDFANRGFVTGLAFSPDGQRLAVSSRKGSHLGNVRVWKLNHGRDIRTLRGLFTRSYRIVFSPDGRFLAALTQDWQVGIWDLANGNLKHVLSVPPGFFADNSGLAFDWQGARLAFVAGQRALLWDVETGRELNSWKLPPGLVDVLGFQLSGKLLLFRLETHDGRVGPLGENSPKEHPRVYRIRELLGGGKLEDLAVIADFDHGVHHAVVPLDASYVVVDGADRRGWKDGRKIKAFEANTGKPLWELPSPWEFRDAPTVYVDHTGQIVSMLVGAPERVIVREMPSGQLLGTSAGWILRREGLVPNAYHWVGTGLYRQGESEPFLTLQDHLRCASSLTPFNRAGKHVAWGNIDGTVMVADIEEVQRRLAPVGLGW